MPLTMRTANAAAMAKRRIRRGVTLTNNRRITEMSARSPSLADISHGRRNAGQQARIEMEERLAGAIECLDSRHGAGGTFEHEEPQAGQRRVRDCRHREHWLTA